MKRSFIVTVFLLYSTQLSSMAAETVIIYTPYFAKPPFVINNDKGTGLDYDLSEFLNSKGDDYFFVTKYIPRKRLDALMVEANFKGLVTDTNPYWWGDGERKKYLWSPPLHKDADDIVSLSSSGVNYEGPESLFGLKVGCVLGFKYFGLQEFMDNGKILRDDTKSEEQNLKKVLAARIDAAIVSRTSLKYFSKINNWQGKFYVSPKPQDSFIRYILIPHTQKAVHEYLEPILKGLASDSAWQTILEKYGLSDK